MNLIWSHCFAWVEHFQPFLNVLNAQYCSHAHISDGVRDVNMPVDMRSMSNINVVYEIESVLSPLYFEFDDVLICGDFNSLTLIFRETMYNLTPCANLLKKTHLKICWESI
jgi:hypothetical protein